MESLNRRVTFPHLNCFELLMGSRVRKPSFNQRPVQADEVCTKEVCRKCFSYTWWKAQLDGLVTEGLEPLRPDTGTACGLGHGSWC